jgi:hypothetical protein
MNLQFLQLMICQRLPKRPEIRMNRVTIKTSTILVGLKTRTDGSHSLMEVAPRLRKKLIESTSGSNSGTIVIADRGGRDEIVRSVRGLPSGVQARAGAIVASRRLQKVSTKRISEVRRVWPELLLLLLLALVIWVVFTIH